jgi:hypothetical protein
MKRIVLIVAAALALSGCKTTDTDGNPGVAPVRIPNAPPELLRKAEQLPELTDPTMGGLVSDAVDTDIIYNDVGFRYNKLIDLYLCVQDSINNKKDIDKCLNP